MKDLYCNSCNALLGWRYCSAKEKAQRYKEGKAVVTSPALCLAMLGDIDQACIWYCRQVCS